MREEERKTAAVAANLSDALFFAPEELQKRLIEEIEKQQPQLAKHIKENINFDG